MNAHNKCLYEFGAFQLDPAEHTLLHDAKVVPLTPKVFDTLLILVENSGHLVEKDELMDKVWEDTIVEEGNLAKNISILRKTLSNDGLGDSFIETVPKRGYRFTADVKEINSDNSQTTKEILKNSQARNSKIKIAIIASALTISVLLIGFYFYSNVSGINGLTDKDVILLTDFENETGEEIFDGTLQQGLNIQLRQSPFLSIFPAEQARNTLELMKRSTDEPITKELGREICQRQGLKAYIAGTITKFGTKYVLTLEAFNSRTDELIALTQVEAESQETILKSLSKAATDIREKLGESLVTIEKYDKPLGKVTTNSLEALKAYSMGHEQGAHGKSLEAISLFKKAIEFDPEFALAYLGLYVSYWDLTKYDLAEKAVIKAYELRENASEKERIIIDNWYFGLVILDSFKRIDGLKTGKHIYPRDSEFRNELAIEYAFIGEVQKAVEEQEELFRLNLDTLGITYGKLAWYYLLSNRFDDVKTISEERLRKGFDHSKPHEQLFYIAFVENDSVAMQKHIDWFRRRPDEFKIFHLRAEAASFQGKWKESQEFSKKAVAAAEQNENEEAQMLYSILHESRAAFFGECLQIESLINSPSRLIKNGFPATFVPNALAQCGKISQAEAQINKLKEKYPRGTLVNGLWIPMFKAQIELEKDNPQEALNLLESAKRYEWAAYAYFYPQFIKGQAHLILGENEKAKVEFQKILDNRGKGPLSVLYPLAQLGKARATKDKSEYEKFFEFWKDADKDLEILIEAKKEYEILR